MRDVISLGEKQASYEAYDYSLAVRSGGFVFVSDSICVVDLADPDLLLEVKAVAKFE